MSFKDPPFQRVVRLETSHKTVQTAKFHLWIYTWMRSNTHFIDKERAVSALAEAVTGVEGEGFEELVQ